MADFDAETLTEQAVLLGLLTRAQVREAVDDAEDGSIEAISRSMLRKQMLTSWQFDKLKKGETAGFVYGTYKVLFHIAEGTFARVYRGVKMPGNQPVAIKVLRNRFLADAGAVERFNKEAEAGLRLVHPNIVRIFDYGEADRRHFMAMEYVEGSNLRDFLKFRVKLSADHALPLMLGMAHGLQYSLSQGVTHRDIKGTNILVSSGGEAKLVDFGLATIDDQRKMAAAHGQRTVDYSALERTCGSPKGDPRSDIYFLGCVFYQMVTGQLPLPEVESKDPLAKMLKRSFGAIKPLSDLPHPPPEELTRIIEKMMKMDLKARYQTMEQVVADLEAYAETQKTEKAEKAEKVSAALPTAPVKAPAVTNGAPEAEAAKSVLCVEAQPEIQDAFRKALSRMGYRVWLYGDPGRAAERYRESPPDAIVYDVDGLGVDGLDAFLDMHEMAHEDGHDLAALVLLGPKQGDLSDRLPDDDRLVILSKPIKMRDVQEALTMLVPVG